MIQMVQAQEEKGTHKNYHTQLEENIGKSTIEVNVIFLTIPLQI